MLSFIPSGYHLGSFFRHVSTSLAIGLAFGIFKSNNGEVSWSMEVLLFWTFYVFPSIMCIENYKMSIFTKFSFVVYLFFCYNILDFFNASFPLKYISLMMKNGWTCPFVIEPKFCIAFGCNNRGIAAFVYTLRCLTMTFGFSNSLHCIDNTCERVHLVMDLIRMNFCWRRFGNLVILLD
jgi:hypothetical protein